MDSDRQPGTPVDCSAGELVYLDLPDPDRDHDRLAEFLDDGPLGQALAQTRLTILETEERWEQSGNAVYGKRLTALRKHAELIERAAWIALALLEESPEAPGADLAARVHLAIGQEMIHDGQTSESDLHALRQLTTTLRQHLEEQGRS